MRPSKKTLFLCAFFFLQGILIPGVALAYIDPATTSYVVQIVAGVVISLGVVLGIYWKKISLAFMNLKVKIMKKRIAKKAEKDKANQ
ncbi:MAG: hypothetical protein GX786_05325 [Clostridiales bacterium]|nr:hypothetical protein [Clostridiales bacterium]